jgi:hypothetical protein
MKALTVADNLTFGAGPEVYVIGDMSVSAGKVVSLTGNGYGPGTLRLEGPVPSLSGPGAIVFNGGRDRSPAMGSRGRFTIEAGMTIRTGTSGGFFFGENAINEGTISAQTPGAMLRLDGPSWTNRGTLRAVDGATLFLNTNWTNTGTIVADHATLALGGDYPFRAVGDVRLVNDAELFFAGAVTRNVPVFDVATTPFGHMTIGNGALIRDTRLISSDGLPVVLRDFSYVAIGSFEGAHFVRATIAADVDVRAAHLNAAGITLEHASIRLTSASMDLTPATTGDTRGTGEIVLLGGSSFITFTRSANGAHVVAPGVTLRTGGGGGTLWASATLPALDLQGTLSAETPGTAITADLVMTSSGTVRAANGGTVRFLKSPANLASGRLTGGTWSVGAASAITFPTGAPITANAATVSLSGPASRFDALASLASNAGSLTLAGGRDFSTVGDLLNTGRIAIGAGSDLTVARAFVQSAAPGSVLELAVAAGPGDGEGFGQLSAGQSVQLGGTLRLTLANGYQPAGDTFTIITGQSVTGTFADYDLPNLPAGASFQVAYYPKRVDVTLIPEPHVAGPLGLAAVAFRPRQRRRAAQPSA